MYLTRKQLGPPTPPGVSVNYTNPQSTGDRILVACPLLAALAFVFIILRLTAKRVNSIAWSWDDGLLVVAVLLAIGRSALGVVGVKHFYIGRHMWDIPPEDSFRYADISRDLSLAGDMLYLFGVMLTKNAILMLYINMFRPKRMFRWLCYGMMVVVSIYLMLFFFLWAFTCTPVGMTWHLIHWQSEGRTASCLNIFAENYAVGAMNIISDGIILVMPFPLLRELRLSKVRKYGLIAVFLVGTFAVICTVIREVIVIRNYKDGDITRNIVEPYVWMSAEFCVGIVCACMPHLAPLLMLLASKMMPSLVSANRRISSKSQLAQPTGMINKYPAIGLNRSSASFGGDSSRHEAESGSIAFTE